MREIKFQLYCQMENGLRKYVVTGIEYLRYGEREISKIHIGDSAIDGRYLKDGLAHLSQYTGLRDKNGREIYEGDIYHQGDTDITYTVVWHDTGLIGKQNRSSSYAGLNYWQDRIEVIGNVYENPALLGN